MMPARQTEYCSKGLRAGLSGGDASTEQGLIAQSKVDISDLNVLVLLKCRARFGGLQWDLLVCFSRWLAEMLMLAADSPKALVGLSEPEVAGQPSASCLV